MSKIKFYEDSAKTNQVYPELDPEEMAQKANIDGYYEEMTVGAADNLTGRGDGVPANFLYRTAGGDEDIADGIATINNIKGNTLVWNQYVNMDTAYFNTATLKGLTFTKNDDNSFTVNGTATELVWILSTFYNNGQIPRIQGHKYLYLANSDTDLTQFGDNLGASGSGAHTIQKGNCVFKTITASGTPDLFDYWQYGFKKDNTYNNVKIKPQAFDLTQMFGEGKEPATIEEFKKIFPLDYYKRNTGTFLNFNATDIKTIGFNQWNEEWELGIWNSVGNKEASTQAIRSKDYIKVFPNTTYYIKNNTASGLIFRLYDINKNFLQTIANVKNQTVTFPNNCHYITICTFAADGIRVYPGDWCLNLSWSGYRNGEYESYWDYTRELPINQYFPGGMKSAPTYNNPIFLGYDELTNTKAIKRAWQYTFTGTENWEAHSNANTFKLFNNIFPKNIANGKLNDSTYTAGGIGSGTRTYYLTYTAAIYITDTRYDTVEQWKQHLVSLYNNGNPLQVCVTLYNIDPTKDQYVVETPIEIPLNLSYKVSDFGTEQILPENAYDTLITSPFNGNISYGVNATDTLRRLPVNYVSKDSMNDFLGELGEATQSSWSATYDDETGKYNYETDLDLSQKANIDGYYEGMSVGIADNLSSKGNGTPALFRRRTAGGNEDIFDGNASINKIKGKSIVWNQLVRFWNQSTEHYQCTVDENQIYTLTYDTIGYDTFTYVTLGLVPGQGNNNNRYGYLNHIFYVRYNIIEQSGTAISRSYINTTTQNNIFPRGLAKDVYGRAYVSLYLALPSNASGSMKFTVSVFDLTKMFGSGNEPTMDEFDYLFPDNINAAEQGTIVNLNNCSLQTTGFNQWDEEWEQGQIEYNKASANWGKNKATAHGIRSKNYIPVFNQDYHCYLGSGAGNVVVLFYDENHNPIANQDLGYKVVGNTTFDILPRTKYIRFYCTAEYGDTYKNDICINLSWSGYRDGEYEEYWDYNRELPINTYFPEGMKSTPAAYDELTENRAISRVGTMVLDGSNDENWVEVPTMSEGYKAYKINNITTIYPDLEVGNYAQFKNRITYNDYSYEEFGTTMSPYTFSLYNIPTGSAYNWLIFSGGNIEELNSISKLRTLLQSRPLIINYVKKEAVTTEIETPLNLSYKVSDFGTEEVLFENNDISKMGIMNADIIYGMNASDTLRRLPINYVSKSSMDNFLGELSNSTQSNWTAEYNDETGVYDYETDLDLSKKANVDGYYEEMTVGAADNLSGKDTGVPANFTFRTSGGNEDVADGMATISEIRGNTILWNQLVSTTTDLTTDYYTKTYDATTKEITITWDTTGAESTIYVTVCGIGNNANNQLGYNNHLFYVRPTYSIRTMDDFTLYINTSQQNNCKDGAFTRINQKTYTTLNMGLPKDTTGSLKFRINVFDLTKMFGIDNEPSTPAEFNSLFPLSYYDYNDGSLLNYTGTSLQTVGFNQWDEEWETGQIWYDKDDPNWGQNRPSSAGIRSKNYIPVFNQAYYCAKLSTSPVYALCYDENYNPIINPNTGLGYINIANTQVTWFPRTKYIRFYTPADYGSIYRNDICINIAWSGYRNGEYEEYWSRNESIDFSEYFPQGMASIYKRNGNNLPPTYIYDSITKEKAIKRTKSYTFTGAESENWSATPSQASTDTYIFRIFNLSDCSHQYSTGIVPTKNSYGWVGDQSIWDKSVNFEGVMLQSNNSCLMFRIRKDKLSEESVAALKTYLSSHPLTIIYEINQYIETEFEEPLRLNYKVSDFGTEKILPENTSTPTTSPFNGNIAYGINASDTIRRLPESYISEESMEAFLSALNTATNGTWTMTYNSETGKYGFTFTPNQGGN